MKRLVAALVVFSLAIQQNPIDAANRNFKSGNMQATLSALAPLLKVSPTPPEALSLAGFAYYRLNKPRQALEMFSQLVGTQQGRAEAAYGMGLALRSLGDLEAARSALRYSLAQDPKYFEAKKLLASLPPTPPISSGTLPQKLQVHSVAKQGRFWMDGKALVVRGVNMGMALPGKFPAEFPTEETLYRSWLELIANMGANTLRTYTLLPPSFYQALYHYNKTNNQRPLYLFQGVWTELPEEEGFDSYDGEFQDKFVLEGFDVIDALHGNLNRSARPGHASGQYTADVSPWVVGWMVGREFEPFSVAAYIKEHQNPSYSGRFLQSSPQSNAFEVWIAAVLDRLLIFEVGRYNTLRPVGFSNWPTLDPLVHPSESTSEEEVTLRRAKGETVDDGLVKELNNDEVSLDSTHILPTKNSPATIYANYHAYPYYPDFMNLEPQYNQASSSLGRSNYMGYLKALKAYHGDQPVVIGEFGVPSSRGTAHIQAQGFDHGGHSEQEQAAINLRLSKEIEEAGLAGGVVFAWLDEWFKRNWLFFEFEYPAERNPLWHNMLDAEQNYGLLAATAPEKFRLDGNLSDWNKIPVLWQKGNQAIKAYADSEYLWLQLQGDSIQLAVDTLAGGSRSFKGQSLGVGAEFLLELSRQSGRLWIEENYYPYKELQTGGPDTKLLVFKGFSKPGEGNLVPFILEPNRRRTGRDGTDYPRKTYELGALKEGQDPPGGRNTMADYAWAKDGVEVRIPWGMLLFSDPSSRTVWNAPQPSSIPGINLWIPGMDKPTRFSWPTWEQPAYALRLKENYWKFQQAWRKP